MYTEADEACMDDIELPVTPLADAESEAVFSYAKYVALGGRIDEANYSRVMQQVQKDARSDISINPTADQTRITADISGISIDAIRDELGIDPRSIYRILRYDKMPDGIKDHHGQMSDQELLIEALRMLGQENAIEAIKKSHPHIPFY